VHDELGERATQFSPRLSVRSMVYSMPSRETERLVGLVFLQIIDQFGATSFA
jgi:hypothetical protein